MEHVRICPDCGEEFRPEIVRCSDCGATLVDRYGTEAPERGADRTPSAIATEAADDDSADDYSAVFSAGTAEAMRDAADALVAAGIAFRLSGNAAAFDLLVHHDDYETAAQALAGREGAVTLSAQPPPQEGHGALACPACETALPAGARECPECQLVVGADGPPAGGGEREGGGTP